jgi:RimJ/RimL family protein N-acetyltransferase
MSFAFEELALSRLTSGHAADNPASGRVLTKLGFKQAGQARVWSTPRACEIDQIKYEREGRR